MERNGGGTWTPDPGSQNHLQGKSVVLGLIGTQGVVLFAKGGDGAHTQAVAFLAGPDSDYITGQTLEVDGGMQFH